MLLLSVRVCVPQKSPATGVDSFLKHMNKKITISIIIILLLIGGGIYWFYSKKPAEERPAIISALFPSAGEKEIEGLPSPSTDGNLPIGGELPGGVVAGKNLIQLTSNAISGAGSASTTIRYVEKSTGHIYEINPDGQNRQRLSNTTILKTFETLWSYRANKLIIRYLESSLVRNLSASVSTTTQGVFLPQSTAAVAVSPNEDKIFYLVLTEETAMGLTANFENKNQKNIFNSPFGEFNVSWPKNDMITLLTKPSAFSEGFFYSLNSQTGKFGKIIGDVKGLTAFLSPDGARVIYSESNSNSLETKIFNIKEKTSSDFDLRTLPEKCAWSKSNKDIVYCAVPDNFPQGDYPDDWYQGLISFKDSIWQKNFSTGETKVLINETNTDVINPFLTKDENYLIFTNKTDNTLWSLKLK